MKPILPQLLLLQIFAFGIIQARNSSFDPKACKKAPFIPYFTTWDGQSNQSVFNVPLLGLPNLCDKDRPVPHHLAVAAGPYNRQDSWMPRGLKIPFILYEANNPAAPHHHWNVGNEAMAYMKFIAEHYECIPEVTLFAHSHQHASWHRSETLDILVDQIDWHSVGGFRYLQTHPERDQTEYVRNFSRNLAGQAVLPPYEDWADCKQVLNDTLYFVPAHQKYVDSQLVVRAWDLFFGPSGMGPVPEQINFSWGAEFLVAKQRILAKPRSFYLDALSFMLELSKTEKMTSYDVGVVFERIWHIIFGENPDFIIR